MPHFICTACGMQYAESAKSPNLPPAQCAICEEERQYVPARGQSWTTLEALSQSHMNSLREYEPGVIGIGAGFRHRPARAVAAHGGRQRAVGLRRHARCRDHDRGQGARRHQGDRHLASAFLHDDGGVGAGLRRAHPSARRRPGLDHAAGSGDLSVGRRNAQTLGRRHADPLRRPLRRRHGAALGEWRRTGAAWFAPATSSPSPPTASGSPSCAAIRISFRCRRARSRRIGAAMAPFSFDMLYGHYFDRVIAKDAKAVLEKSIARYIAAVEGKRGY